MSCSQSLEKRQMVEAKTGDWRLESNVDILCRFIVHRMSRKTTKAATKIISIESSKKARE